LTAKSHQGESTKQTELHCSIAAEFLTERAKETAGCDVWPLGVTFLSPTMSTRLKEMFPALEFPAEVPQNLAKVIPQMLSFNARMTLTMAQLLENPTFTVVKSRS
jgi:hypothetical protein